MVVLDGFSTFINALLLVSGMLGIALAYGYVKRMGIERGEYYILLLFSVTGMMLMAQAADLIMVFLALELLSIPLYVLAGIRPPQSGIGRSRTEILPARRILDRICGLRDCAGLRCDRIDNLITIGKAFGGTVDPSTGSGANLLLTIGAALILVGFGFKVAAVPFHMWTPDVYQGAPSAVTAFMSSGAKIAGFAALLRVFATAFPSLAG